MNWKRTTSDMAKKKIIKTKARPKAKTRAKARAKAKANAKVKHKPSTKRTLEEVLSSLQDLTKNELSDADLHSRAGTEPEKNQIPGVPTENAGQAISDNKTDHSEDDESIELDVVPDQAELISGETGDIFEGLELLPGVEITDENQIDQTITLFNMILVCLSTGDKPDQVAKYLAQLKEMTTINNHSTIENHYEIS